VTHVFSICTPFFKPTKEFVPMDQQLKKTPQLGYQVNRCLKRVLLILEELYL